MVYGFVQQTDATYHVREYWYMGSFNKWTIRTTRASIGTWVHSTNRCYVAHEGVLVHGLIVAELGEVETELSNVPHEGVLVHGLNGAECSFNVPHEGVLVHGLDVAELGDVEEEPGDVHGDGPIGLARGVDARLRLLCDGLLLVDLYRQLLRVRDHNDRCSKVGLGLERGSERARVSVRASC